MFIIPCSSIICKPENAQNFMFQNCIATLHIFPHVNTSISPEKYFECKSIRRRRDKSIKFRCQIFPICWNRLRLSFRHRRADGGGRRGEFSPSRKLMTSRCRFLHFRRCSKFTDNKQSNGSSQMTANWFVGAVPWLTPWRLDKD